MSNRNVVMTEKGEVVGEYYTSLACFALVTEIIKKHNLGANVWSPEGINKALEPVYENCEGHETVQLLLFINDESDFDMADIPHFEKAIREYRFGNEGPKKHLVFVRDMLEKHGQLKTKYMDTTCAIAVTSAER